MQKYETIFIIDSLLKGEEIDNIINKYERFLSANGGQIETVERWGKKRLAYEIKKRQYGYYVLIRFDGPPTMIKPLEREYRLNESLLRYKTLAMPKRAIAALEMSFTDVKSEKSEKMDSPAASEDKVATTAEEVKKPQDEKEPEIAESDADASNEDGEVVQEDVQKKEE